MTFNQWCFSIIWCFPSTNLNDNIFCWKTKLDWNLFFCWILVNVQWSQKAYHAKLGKLGFIASLNVSAKNDFDSNVLRCVVSVAKLWVVRHNKQSLLQLFSFKQVQQCDIWVSVCIDLRPSELYRASTIDHPNSTVHRPSTIRTLPCIDHRPSRFKKRASDIELPSSVLL